MLRITRTLYRAHSYVFEYTVNVMGMEQLTPQHHAPTFDISMIQSIISFYQMSARGVFYFPAALSMPGLEPQLT